MDDGQIIELYFRRDESAIRETDIKYGRLCFGIAHNILGAELDAEECVNDTYFSVWNAIPPQRPNCFAAFIGRIARSLSLKRLRFNTARKRSAQAELSLSELEEILPDDRWRPDLRAESLGELISCFLRGESEDARRVFLRRYWFFDSIADIAADCSFSESKVKSMLLRTRRRLRDYLREEGVYL